MQWVNATFGLLFLCVSLLVLLIAARDARGESWRSRVGFGALLVCCAGFGAWQAWPILVLPLDFLYGTDTARAIVRDREVPAAEQAQTLYSFLRTFFDVPAVVLAFAAPFLW